jgi:hypothetical protein
MDSQEIVLKADTKRTAGWLCSACRAVWSNEDRAEACCRPRQCVDCKEQVAVDFVRCNACSERVRAAEEDVALLRAHKVWHLDYKDHCLYWDRSDDNGGFFPNREALAEHCQSQHLKMPLWVWGSLPRGFLIDVEAVLAGALEDHPYEARNLIPVSEVKRLQDFMDEWAMAQSLQSFDVDDETAVILDERLLSSIRCANYLEPLKSESESST